MWLELKDGYGSRPLTGESRQRHDAAEHNGGPSLEHLRQRVTQVTSPVLGFFRDSVRPRCLCGEMMKVEIHHRGTELSHRDTELANPDTTIVSR